MDHCHRPTVTYTFTLLIIFLSLWGIHHDHVVITSLVINMVIKSDMIVKITSLINAWKIFCVSDSLITAWHGMNTEQRFDQCVSSTRTLCGLEITPFSQTK